MKPKLNKVGYTFLVFWAAIAAKRGHGYSKKEEMDTSGYLVSFVKEPSAIIGELMPSVNVESGNDFIIGCSLKNVANNITIYWEVRHLNRLVTITSSSNPVPVNGDKYEVDTISSKDNDFKDTSILTVSSAVDKDGGLYLCSMFYEGRKIEAKVKVHVKGPPLIKIYEHLVYAAEGEEVRLMCTFMSASLDHQVDWFRNGQKLLNASDNRIYQYLFLKRGYVDHKLVIMATTVGDQGNYTCRGTNKHGTSEGHIRLQVKQIESSGRTSVSPSYDGTQSITMVMPQYSRLTMQSTGSVRLCCSATLFSSKAVMWWMITSITGNELHLKPTDEFFYQDAMMRTYVVSNTSGTFYSLAMDTLAINFTGTYSCNVKDSGQLYSDKVDIKVIGPPIATAKVTEMNGLLAEKIVLTCDVWSSPPPTLLKWYFEDKIISSSQRLVETEQYHNTVHFDMMLTITELRATDFGVYSCKVYNNRGNTLAVQVIQDLDECSFPDTNPCNSSVCVNQLGSVHCQCNPGYGLVPGSDHICQDIDECNTSKPCDHLCTNTDGSYICTCKAGYLQLGNKCEMIDNPVTPVTDAPGGRGDEEDDESDLDTLYSVIGAIAGALLVTLLIILVFMWCRRNRMDGESITMKDRFMDNVAYQSSGDSKIKLSSFMSEMNKSVLPRDEFPRQRLQLGIDLGQGRFGKVMMARALNINGNSEWEMVAVKTCKDCAMDCEKEDLYQELEIMRKIPHHPNIVDYLGCCTQQDPVYIIMEYVRGSNLQQHLRKFRPSQLATTSEELEPLSAKDLNTYALHVSRGMEHLAKIGIIHRDLAARNILVGGTKVCKICDFGLARNVEGTDVYERSSKGPQPIRWMAPEGLADQCFTKKSDVWSYGVLLWELVTLGATPYPGMSAREVIATVMMGKWLSRPFHCKQEMYSLMVQCWDMEPRNRPTFVEISHNIEKLLEREAEYIELTEYKEGAFSDLDPNLVDERV